MSNNREPANLLTQKINQNHIVHKVRNRCSQSESFSFEPKILIGTCFQMLPVCFLMCLTLYPYFSTLSIYFSFDLTSVINSYLTYSSFEMSLLPWKQALEAEYFNWKYLIYSKLAQSPGALEDQHLVEYGPWTYINGDKWVKCDKCFNPYHIECLQEHIPVGKYMCTFFGCQK